MRERFKGHPVNVEWLDGWAQVCGASAHGKSNHACVVKQVDTMLQKRKQSKRHMS